MRTENQSDMEMASDPIEVSVICTTYNHAPYIAYALEGFLSQKTTFKFEVIVNDDASNDGTANIVAAYQASHPDTVRAFLRKVNQKGRVNGIGATKYLIENEARGKYIALCEGDDYWIDESKLQKQYDFLEKNTEYSLCLHNAVIEDQEFGVSYLSEPLIGDRCKSFEQIILEGGGGMNPTASFFFRKSCYASYKLGPVGDHFVMMTIARGGRVWWMEDPMSVYRLKTDGSWTQRAKRASVEKVISYRDSYIEALEWMDEATGHAYADVFMERCNYQVTTGDRLISTARYTNGEESFARHAMCLGLMRALRDWIEVHHPKWYIPARRLELIARMKRSSRLVDAKLKFGLL